MSLQVAKRSGPPATGFLSGSGETLLGMAQGHWDIREEEINKPSFTQDRKRGVNYGIALVVPASKIYETIYQPGLTAMRRRLEKELLRQRQSTPGIDSIEEKEAEPFTGADFEAALNKATRKLDGESFQDGKKKV